MIEPEIFETSVSQIENFERCPSKWAYGQVHGIGAAKNKSAEEGIDVHQHLENYSRYGQKFDDSQLGKLAALALPYLPGPEDEPLIEEDTKLRYEWVSFRMSADAVWDSFAGVTLNDYKSVKHYRFALTGPKLRSNLQACVYGLKFMQHFAASEVNLCWIYLQRPPTETHVPGPADIRVVTTTADEDDCRAVIRSKMPTIKSMQRIKKAKLPMAEISRNEMSCQAYGGCGYRGHCFPDKFDRGTGKPLEAV